MSHLARKYRYHQPYCMQADMRKLLRTFTAKGGIAQSNFSARPSHFRSDAGPESHGSLRDGRVAWDQASNASPVSLTRRRESDMTKNRGHVKSILDQSFRYTPSNETDLKKTFAKIRRQQRLSERLQAQTGSEANAKAHTNVSSPTRLPGRVSAVIQLDECRTR